MRHTLDGHTEIVRSVAFSPNGRTLASGGYHETITLWDVATGKNIATLNGHFQAVYCVVFNPDGKTLAAGMDDGTIKLWDVEMTKDAK